ncbi:hypothetical protein [Nonomuraea sp. NPDC003709]|uniref:hypothetical protein n=1 Tax=Nonomuraea sp. NPDC003709 TaxID=3154450 RepID=UPI0033A3E438
MSDLQPGVYQHLITRELDGLLRAVPDRDLIDRRALDIADSHETLARHLAALTRRALRSVRGENDAVRLARQVEIVNKVADLIDDLVPEAASPEELLEAAEELLGVAKSRDRDAAGAHGREPYRRRAGDRAGVSDAARRLRDRSGS